MRESRPTPIGAELSDVMLGAQQKESQTRAVQWRDQQLLQGSSCRALPPFERSKIEKAVASDEIWRNVGWRRVVQGKTTIEEVVRVTQTDEVMAETTVEAEPVGAVEAGETR